MSSNYYQWPNCGWWKSKERIARRMSIDALYYSIDDCQLTILANPDNSPKYFDEASIYRKELDNR